MRRSDPDGGTTIRCAPAPQHRYRQLTPRAAEGHRGRRIGQRGALVVPSRVEAASACETRQRQICKDYFAKGDPLTLCQQRGLTQGQCINECTAERTALKCS